MKKRNIFKVLALLCVLVLVVGSIPVSAAKLPTISKRINKGLAKAEANTIRITTKAEGTIIIHSGDNTENKRIYVKAPNAKVVNYADLDIVSIKSCKKFVEKGTDNDIKVSGAAKVQITPGGKAGKIDVRTSAPVDIVVGAEAKVEEIVINKKGANVDVAVLEDASANITVNKKADVTLNGENSDIALTNKAEGTTVEVNTMSDITTSKDIKVVLGANADGTEIDAANDVIVVDVENPNNTAFDLMINGEKINSDGPGQSSGSAITFNTGK